MRLFILAGEPSGDRLGAALIEDLRQRGPLELSGIGGPDMAAAGLASLFPMSDLSVMGFTDVLARLPLLLRRIGQTVAAIRKARPNAVVLIDSQEFAFRTARAVRRFAPDLPILLYVAPSVWAWRPERAPRLKPVFTEIHAVLPFEPEVMARLGGPPTVYVGHPALQRFPAANDARDERLIALLPGSRRGELRQHVPLLQEAVDRIRAEADVRFVLPTLPNLAGMVRSAFPRSIEIVVERDAATAAMQQATMAISGMGTATLELAAAGTPHVSFYHGDWLVQRAYDKAKPRFVALPNILLRRPVVEEVLMRRPEPARLAQAALTLWRDRNARSTQQAAFVELRQLMESGLPNAPKASAAERVLALARG